MYSTRQFAIFSTTEIPRIDFHTVCETSAETLRRSVDGTQTFVKWDGETPAWIESLTTLVGLYTYEDMLTILAGPTWTPPLESSEV